jgi:hypothetical protein
MIILVPFFGDVKRFRPVLDRWIYAYEASGCKIPWYMVGDRAEDLEAPCVRVKIEPFRDLIRPGQPFDHKGAIVCAAALQIAGPVLVLDSDAMLVRDPLPILERFLQAPVSMPADHGALVWFRTPKLEWPFESVRKACAGVLLLGPAAHRPQLVAAYRRAWHQMKGCLPWRPNLPHLLEQYSWSVAMHGFGPSWLPVSLNWSSRHLGASPDVVIEHDYGHGKWNGARAPRNS